LRIVLRPERIELMRSGRKLTARGYQRHVHDNVIIPCAPAVDETRPWNGAIKTLEMNLPSFAERKTEVNVVLSNHFMHYLLVPWLSKLSDEEEMVFAQHCFKEMYGSAADSWSVRTSPGPAGVATVASAVDTRLLDELRELLGRMGLDIRSIQPDLMEAYNSCRDILEGRNAWIALLEPGSLCLAVLQKGQLVWIRKLRIGDVWHEELPTLLEREAYLADAEAAMDEVFLWAPHLEGTEIPAAGRWKIRHLQATPKPQSGREGRRLRDLAGGQR
jgi:hypothetical protein